MRKPGRDADFVSYGDLSGPELQADQWTPVPLPLPTGGTHLPMDPGANVTVGDDAVDVVIPRFSLSDDNVQSADSAKYLMLSTRRFGLLNERPVTFAVDLTVRNIGGQPADYRRGMAAFQVGDLESKRVFSVCGTSTRVLALHEQVGPGGDDSSAPFYYVVESPYADFDDDFTRPRSCEITLDPGRSVATWRVDGQLIYEVQGTLVPDQVQIGFGIWTMLPIRAGRSRSVDDGQGLHATWRGFRVRGSDR